MCHTLDDKILVAKAALFIDDPYRDGIRLEHVRNPSEARLVAIDLVHKGQASIDAMDVMLAEYGDALLSYVRIPMALAAMRRNSSLTVRDTQNLRSFILDHAGY